MATLFRKTERGREVWMLQVSVPGRGRKTVRLGDAPEQVAQRFKARIEGIAACRRLNLPIDPESARWIAGLHKDVYADLVAIGLAEPRDPTPTPTPVSTVPGLKAFFDSYIESKRPEIAERSIALLEQTRDRLVRAMGATTPIDKVTPGGAMDWRAAMLRGRLSEATVRMHSRNAKSAFNDAIRREILTKNPFRSLPTAAIAANRDFYLTVETAEKVLAKLDGVGLRLFFGLMRYGGLRATSETHILTWDKVDLPGRKMQVYAPKTGQTRAVPIVPRLKELFEAARRVRFKGNDLVLQISFHNLHNKVIEAAEAAGVERWDDLFQTLRRAAATDFARVAPPHAVAAWMGHSVLVSAKHYLQVPAELFDRVTGPMNSEMHSPMNPNTPSSALQNALQHGAAQGCISLQTRKSLQIAG